MWRFVAERPGGLLASLAALGGAAAAGGCRDAAGLDDHDAARAALAFGLLAGGAVVGLRRLVRLGTGTGSVHAHLLCCTLGRGTNTLLL